MTDQRDRPESESPGAAPFAERLPRPPRVPTIESERDARRAADACLGERIDALGERVGGLDERVGDLAESVAAGRRESSEAHAQTRRELAALYASGLAAQKPAGAKAGAAAGVATSILAGAIALVLRWLGWLPD